MAKFLDITGKKFGRLRVIKFSKEIKSGKRNRKYWLCKCDCGNFKEIRTDSLTSGLVQSCGCLKKEQDKLNLTDKYQFKKKYKVQNKRLYSIWKGIISRCTDKNNKRYNRYGERNIIVCDEWFCYDNFANWALSNGYSEKLTIDRINNEGNYESSNCRWVDIKTQCRNRSTNILVKHEEKEITLIELSEKTDISYSCLRSRYSKGLVGNKLIEKVKIIEESRAKLSIEDVKEIRKKHSDGYTIKQLSEIYPVTYSSISNIVHRRTWKNI
ncbi:TPA: hypothetical protein ACG3PH_001964 [Clostridioides difficile]